MYSKETKRQNQMAEPTDKKTGANAPFFIFS